MTVVETVKRHVSVDIHEQIIKYIQTVSASDIEVSSNRINITLGCIDGVEHHVRFQYEDGEWAVNTRTVGVSDQIRVVNHQSDLMALNGTHTPSDIHEYVLKC